MADQRNESGETLDELFERLDDHDTLEFDDGRRYLLIPKADAMFRVLSSFP